jgi:alkaline phosphatase D
VARSIRFYERAVQRLSRRQLLNISWKLGAAAILQPLVPIRVLTQPLFMSYPFTLGVASGDPWADSIVLWTRLAPDPLEGGGMPMASVQVAWEMASDSAFRTVVQKGTAIARPELGHCVHVEVQGLESGREYWYRFRAGSEVSEVGRAVTAPAGNAVVDRLRFAVCGCSQYPAGYFTAYRRIAEERFDFVFHTGDYIYEGRGISWDDPGRTRQHKGQELYTLVDYRNRYAQYKTDPDLRAAHASAPFIVTWDDHEVDNDYAGEIDAQSTPPEVFLLRRAAAYQAYYEMMPLRAVTFPAGPRMLLYRRLRFGNLVDLSVLDTRQYRSDQVCAQGATTNCAAATEPERTILGAEQEKWLFDQLATARAKWTVLGQQVPSFAFAGNMDKWDGYVAARRRLYSRLRETKAANPIVLSGDVHQHFAADLKMDFADPRSETVGV